MKGKLGCGPKARNKEGTLFTCIARQSKLASSAASKYKAQKQTKRERKDRKIQEYETNATLLLLHLFSVSPLVFVSNEKYIGRHAYKALNSTSCLDFIVFAFNMELRGHG